MTVIAESDAGGSRMRSPAELDVPVAGGNLRVCRWGNASRGDRGGPAVVAIHGITANALSFLDLAEQLPGVDLIAPDLRGRAGSAALPGPFGLGVHVEDIVAALDHLGIADAVFVGHSMGGFVAALTAVRHPGRVRSVLLVDGGVAFGVPVDADIDQILERVIGPAMRRLRMTFASRAEYVAFWRAHPALADAWSPRIEAYALRDLVGDRSSCNVEAIRADAKDTLVHEETTTAYRSVGCPISLLRAERGMLDEPTGLYGHAPIEDIANELVPGVNHYTVMASPKGAAVVADRIRGLLSVGA